MNLTSMYKQPTSHIIVLERCTCCSTIFHFLQDLSTMTTLYLMYLDLLSMIVHSITQLRDFIYRVCYIMEVPQPPTPGTGTVTKEFLSHLFGQNVSLVRHETLHENQGFAGNRMRIEVTFHSDIETFLILKTSLATRIGRKQILFGTSGIREVLFYKSKYASRMKEFQQIP